MGLMHLSILYPSEYSSWENMKQRCNNPKSKGYHNYGGRGIELCDRWDKFKNFIKDMGPKPGKQYSIERINNNLGYYPENCRWATPKEQARNMRTTSKVNYLGKYYTVAELAEVFNLNRSTLRRRILRGEPEALWSRPSNKTGILTEASKKSGLPKSTIINRMKRKGLFLEDALYGYAK